MTNRRRTSRAAVLLFAALAAACSNTDPSSDSAVGSSDANLPTSEPVSSSSVESTLPALLGVECSLPDDQPETRTLEVWSILVDEGEAALNETMVRFNRLHPELAVRVTYSDSQDNLLNRLRNGERPDLVITGSDGVVNLMDSGIVTPVSRCMEQTPEFSTAGMLPTALPTYSRGDTIVAMPVAISSPVLFYDKNTFRAAGLDPERPPRTMDEFEAALRRTVESGVAATGLTYAEATWFVVQWAAQCGQELLPGDNGRTAAAAAPTVSFEGECLSAALDRLRSWSADGLIAAPGNDPTGIDDLVRLIRPDEKAGMALHTSGSISQVINTVDSSSFDADVGVGPFPGPGTGAHIGGSAAYITADGPVAAWDAWTFVQFLVDGPQQALFGTVGYAPLRADALDDPDLMAAWAEHPQLRVPYDQLVDIPVSAAMLTPVSGVQEHLFFRCRWAAEDIIRGTQNDDALGRAAVDIDGVLDSYWTLRQAP